MTSEFLRYIRESYDSLEEEDLTYNEAKKYIGFVLDYLAYYFSDGEFYFPDELLNVDNALSFYSDIPIGTYVSFVKYPGNSFENIEGVFVISTNHLQDISWILKYSAEIKANTHKVIDYDLFIFEDNTDHYTDLVNSELMPFRILESFCDQLNRNI